MNTGTKKEGRFSYVEYVSFQSDKLDHLNEKGYSFLSRYIYTLRLSLTHTQCTLNEITAAYWMLQASVL